MKEPETVPGDRTGDNPVALRSRNEDLILTVIVFAIIFAIASRYF